MATFLFACAAMLAGYFLPDELAVRLLTRRNFSDDFAVARQRMAKVASALAAGLFAAAFFSSAGAPAALYAYGALICIIVIAITDLEKHVICWVTCIATFVFAVAYQSIAHGADGLFAATLAALIMEACCICCLLFSRRFGAADAFGSGDLRIIPALCIATGAAGTLVGIICCCVVSLAVAFAYRLMRADNWRQIPMGPGLLIWFAVGMLI